MICALNDFLRIAGTHTIDDQIPLVDSRPVRRELFKLSYQQNKFGLNMKADAFEAFDFLLTSIHSWASNARTNQSEAVDQDNDHSMRDEQTYKLVRRISQVSCQDPENRCFVHNGYYLSKVVQRVCKTCKNRAHEANKQDPNLFAETVFVPEIVSELDVLAEKKAELELEELK